MAVEYNYHGELVVLEGCEYSSRLRPVCGVIDTAGKRQSKISLFLPQMGLS